MSKVTPPPPKAEAVIQPPGPPGTKVELHVLPIKANEQRNDRERIRDSSKRSFKIFARLSKMPLGAESVKISFDSEDGSSYFVVPGEVFVIRAQSSEGMFDIRKNENGELSLVQFECVATDTRDARKKFHLAVMPFLNHLSYVTNCPVVLAALRVEDPKNENTSIECVAPFLKATVNPHSNVLFNEMAPVYAMYREAKNSSSDFYRFLCYYKILEGLLGTMRAEVYRLAREKAITLARSRDRVPTTEFLEFIPVKFQSYIGKPIKAFFDDVMTPQFRNAVAHFNTVDGAVLNMSAPEHVDRYSEIQLLCDLCVRTVIQSHETLIQELYSSKRP